MKTTSDNVRGVSFSVLASLIFSLQNIAVKWIGGDYLVLEIVNFRSLIALPCTVLFHRYEGQRGLPTTQRHTLEYTRGFFVFSLTPPSLWDWLLCRCPMSPRFAIRLR